ncbi:MULTISPECIES: hypothetical protein [Cyanophyceae]|uniref:Uncharacterized protein n=1 Tax=Stenomitos frigidus AS-A4 TaxID=2933935 RepID=A0ABV0KGW6_9CYAN|nr:hypothetical protein [Phormidium sp. FACHB-592]
MTEQFRHFSTPAKMDSIKALRGFTDSTATKPTPQRKQGRATQRSVGC